MYMPDLNRFLLVACTVVLLLTGSLAMADPWARPGDLALRHDIQLLADAGLIEAPVNTWPMPWGALAAGLVGRSPPEDASPEVLAARARLVRRIEEVQGLRGLQPSAKAGVRSDAFWLRGFEDTPREESELRVGLSWMSEFVAMRAQLSVAPDSDVDDQEWRTDGSYLAGIWGNQIFYASAVDRWWGPSHQDTLILSSNARPVYGLGMQRNIATPFETRWLSWLGPWTYDFMWGFLESDREIPDARLMAFRFNFRPISEVEIGVTRTAVWCGQGRPCDTDALWDIFTGNTNVDAPGVTPETEAANQLAAIDVRWQSPFTQGPWAIYAQAVAEDEAGGFPSRYFGQAGVETWGRLDTRWLSGSWRGYVEYTNTLIHFWRSEPYYKLAYEHGLYKTGYRYRGRSLGAAADRDSQLITVGMTVVDAKARTWNGVLRFAEINNQGNRSERDLRHTVSPDELKVYSGHLSHRQQIEAGGLKLGTISLGLGAQRTENRITGSTDTDVHAFVQWTWDYSGL